MMESEEQGAAGHVVHPRIAFWLRELPYIVVLALTIFGVEAVAGPRPRDRPAEEELEDQARDRDRLDAKPVSASPLRRIF